MKINLPTDPKDIKAIREFFTQQRESLNAMADCLEEPWKSHFNNLKGEYNSALEALPPSDQAPAALEANRHLNYFCSLLAQANGLNSMLASHMASLKQGNQAAFNSAIESEIKKRIDNNILIPAASLNSKVQEGVAVAVTSEIDRRVKAGELVAKDVHAGLVQQARENGLKEGREALQRELDAKAEQVKVVEGRRAALATAGIPVPEKEILTLLGGTDAEFATRKAEAEARLDGLKKKNSALNTKNPVWAKIWLPKDQWEVIEQLLGEQLTGQETPNPLAGAGAAAKSSNIGPMLV